MRNGKLLTRMVALGLAVIWRAYPSEGRATWRELAEEFEQWIER